MPKDQNKKSPKNKDKANDKSKKDKYNVRSSHTDKRRKKVVSSDSSDSSESEDELDTLEYKKFLSKIFPSRYINERVKEINHNSRKAAETESESESESEDEEEYVLRSRRNRRSNKRVISRKSRKSRSKYQELSEDETEESDDDDDDDHDTVNPQFNIILTLGDPKHYEEEEDYDEDEDEDYDDDESEESLTPKKGSKLDKELDEELNELLNHEDEGDSVKAASKIDKAVEKLADKKEHKRTKLRENKLIKNKKIKSKKTQRVESESEDNADEVDSEVDNEGDNEENSSSDSDVALSDKQIVVNFMRMAKNLQMQHKNKVIDEFIDMGKDKYKQVRKKEEAKDKKAKQRNLQKFRKTLSEKNAMNDYAFFGKMALKKQEKLIAELEEVNKHAKIETPYRISLLESDIPIKFKGAAMKKINALKYMEPGAGEYYKSKTWVDTFMHIPFGKYHELPINRSHGIDVCHEFMEDAKKTLDTAVYGLNDAKLQIMQMVGQWISNPKAVGTSIAIKGPMGTGKTTLVKEGISKILNREFAFIALGGATDSSFLEGHSYTYEGSTWGKIVDILIQNKTMNPIIYFDELDKISDTPKGEEIAGILTHLTDGSQNSQFHDKYFAEIDFDLSKCLFIFSYNDESKINPILKDRMYRIQTKGYSKKEKSEIANNYLLPTIRTMIDFDKEDIEIETDALHYIIDTYTEDEQGVRNLKRALEIIHTKLNLYRLMKPGTNLFEEDMSLEVTFPFTVTVSVVDKLLRQSDASTSHMSMYM